MPFLLINPKTSSLQIQRAPNLVSKGTPSLHTPSLLPNSIPDNPPCLSSAAAPPNPPRPPRLLPPRHPTRNAAARCLAGAARHLQSPFQPPRRARVPRTYSGARRTLASTQRASACSALRPLSETPMPRCARPGLRSGRLGNRSRCWRGRLLRSELRFEKNVKLADKWMRRARLAKIKQNQAKSISKRAKPLGRKFWPVAFYCMLGFC